MKAIPLNTALERRTQCPAAPARIRVALVGALDLLREWRQQPPDPEGEEGYPEQIEPLRLREASLG